VKQVLLQGGQAVVVDVPAPQVPRGGALVRVAFSVVSSGTERANLQSTGESVLAKARRKPELAMAAARSVLSDGVGVVLDRVRNKIEGAVPTGYSCAGTVVAVGAGVTDLTVGQQVACAGSKYAWHAEYVAVPRNLLCAVPQGVSLRDAASATVGAIALQGVRQAALEIGHVVVVTGLGLLGLLSVQLARAAGAQVIAVDPVEGRREAARRFGALAAVAPDEVGALVNEITHGLGADRTILTAATHSDGPLRQAMDVTRKRGIVVVVGDVGLGLTRSPFYEKEVELRISCSYGPGRYDPAYEEGGQDYPAAFVRWTENRNMQSYLELVRAGSVDWAALVEREADVDDAADVFTALHGGSAPLAVTLRFPSHDAPGPIVGRTVELAPRGATRPVAKGVVRLGVIGAGAFARSVHLPHLKRNGKFAVTGIASRTGASARDAARQAGAAFYTTDYEELLARPDVDAVLIATRHDTHARLAMKALDAGKAVFLEKPLAIDQAQLDEVLDAIARSELPFMVGFNRRFSPAAAWLRERIAAHATPPVVTYRVNADPGGANDWSQGEEGGGRAVGEGCHMIDFLHALAGDAPIEELQVLAARGRGAPDANFTAQLRFANGMLAQLMYTTRGAKPLGKERIEAFLGEEVAVVDDYRKGTVYRPGLAPTRSIALTKGLREEWDVFHRACTSADRLPVSLATLRSVTEATFRIREEALR
jgi:predicted dehydrogenase/threonine dehydrogenase-like Zn-dependent dehydrogenase